MTDLVNLDRVRGLLRTIYWRRRFLAHREEQRRVLNAESEGIPAIILDPTPASPPLDENPFERISTPSPPGTPGFNPSQRPLDFSRGWSGARNSPSLSASGYPRPSVSRQLSNASMLSSEDAHNRRYVRLSGVIFDDPAAESLRWRKSLWRTMMILVVVQYGVVSGRRRLVHSELIT